MLKEQLVYLFRTIFKQVSTPTESNAEARFSIYFCMMAVMVRNSGDLGRKTTMQHGFRSPQI